LSRKIKKVRGKRKVEVEESTPPSGKEKGLSVLDPDRCLPIQRKKKKSLKKTGAQGWILQKGVEGEKTRPGLVGAPRTPQIASSRGGGMEKTTTGEGGTQKESRRAMAGGADR